MGRSPDLRWNRAGSSAAFRHRREVRSILGMLAARNREALGFAVIRA
jgi:hypothetical protein